MQKRTNRILSALMALIMVLSMLPAAVFAAGETDALEGWSITLGDNIGVKFYLNSESYTVSAEVNGEAVTPAVSGNVATVNVAAAQMNDPIVLTVKDGSEVVHTGEYSVRQYADTILNGEYAGYVKNMVKEMLNYGAAAQTYFAYNTGNLANSGISVDAAAVPTEVPEISVTDSLDGISLYGMSLVFRNKVAVRFYFKVTGDISSFTFSQGTPVQKGEYYYVEIDGINPQDLANDITLNVNGGALSVTYSPLTYIVRMYNSEDSSAQLKALVQAMYGYHLEAEYYNSIIPVTGLANHNAGWDIDRENSNDGLYIQHNAHTATYNSDWSVEYKPVSADAIKLVRGGETFNVAEPTSATLVVFSATEMYLKLESWTITGDKLPLVDGDQLILDGEFKHDASGDIIAIEKTIVVVANGGLGINAISVGTLGNHSGGAGGDGVHVTMADNNAAYNSDWSLEYAPLTADAYRVIRDGVETSIGQPGRGTLVKFGATEGYIKHSGWCVNEFAAQTSDIFIIEGFWKDKAGSTVIQIDKTYMYHNGATWVLAANLPTTVNAGAMLTHESGMSGNGIYFRTAANEAPFNNDWSLEYKQTSVDNIKLIRGGVTTSIGIVDRPMFVRINETDYYLKLENWTIGDYAPITTEDMLIIEGDFFYAAENVTLNITKSYVYYDGSAWVCAANEPVPETVYEVGVLSAHDGGGSSTGLHAVGGANEAPYDWAAEYAPTSAECIKIVRGGQTYATANTGAGTVIKFDANGYYIKFDGWMNSNYPLQAGDMIIIEGVFVGTGNYAAAEGVKIKIDKTYIVYDGSTFTFSATEPVPETVYEVGVLSAHTAGGSGTGFYANGLENDAPYSDWAAEYAPTSKECIQIIRNGETIYRENTGAGAIIKLGGTGYYVKFDAWIDSANYPLQAGDMIIMEGVFVGTGNYAAAQGVKIKIDKTYIVYDGSTFTFSATEPAPDTTHKVGVLTSNSSGVITGSNGINGIYATCEATNATCNADWSIEYSPVSSENYKLIRGGVTYNVGIPGQGTLVMISQTNLYLKQEAWTVSGNLLPLQAGDILVVEGEWSCIQDAASVIKIDTTYITIGSSSATFSAEDPRIVSVGAMYAQGGTNWSGDLINFALDANEAPSNSDWSVEYVPVSNEAIKLIRNGETKNIANTGAGTIIKLSESNCILKLESWMIGDVYPITEGDVLIVEGAFKQKNGDYTMVIDKTYIIIGNVANDEVTFTTHYENTDFGTVVLPTSNDTLKIGMWNGSYHVFEDKQLQELKAAGITKIMGINTQWIGTEDVNAWLDRVYSYGIRVIIDLRDWDGETVPSYANHPGLIGFLMYDEPNADVFDDLAALKTKFDAVMPADKLFYVNLFPECAADSSLGTESSWWESLFGDEKDYDTDYVTAFLNALDIEVLSWDNYSLLNGNGIRTEYFHNFEVMAGKNLPMWYTMLSAGHPTTAGNTYATPTAGELRWQMAVAMTYGVQNIDHYTYVSHEDGYSCMVEYETWEPTALYYDIKTVDNEYLAWDHIFMAYDWQGVGVYDNGSSNVMLSVLENKLNLANYGLTVSSSNQDLLIGVFDHNGDKAYMVTNAGSAGSSTVGDGKNFVTGDATVTLSLGSGSYKCVAVIDNGTISYVAVNADNTVTLNVQAYEGVFVIPVQN